MQTFKSGKIKYINQNRNWEFLSLFIFIDINITALLLFLIYKSDSDSLQDTWLKNWQPEKITYFAVSANDWTCNKFGLNWLKKIFHIYIKNKSGHRKHLLIINNYSNHINMRFIKKYNKFQILLLILPPYLTYYLQPLNVSLFSPLSTYYNNGLNKLIFNSLNIINILKRTFWSIFYFI